MLKNGVKILIVILIFTGCVNHQIKDINNTKNSGDDTNPTNVDDSISTDNSAPTKDIEEENIKNNGKIVQEDLNIIYNGIVINDIIDFNVIADSLGIEIGKTDVNCTIRMGTSYGNWYVVHYPIIENEDIELEYFVNEQNNTVKLVRADLYKNAETFRGVSIGDSLEKVINVYGNNIEPDYNSLSSVAYHYILDYNEDEPFYNNSIYIIVDNDSKKVTGISFDYNSSKEIDEFGIEEV